MIIRDDIIVAADRPRWFNMSQLLGTHIPAYVYEYPRDYCFGLIESFVSVSSPARYAVGVIVYTGDDTADKYVTWRVNNSDEDNTSYVFLRADI